MRLLFAEAVNHILDRRNLIIGDHTVELLVLFCKFLLEQGLSIDLHSFHQIGSVTLQEGVKYGTSVVEEVLFHLGSKLAGKGMVSLVVIEESVQVGLDEGLEED